jgi:hypothetical protein
MSFQSRAQHHNGQRPKRTAHLGWLRIAARAALARGGPRAILALPIGTPIPQPTFLRTKTTRRVAASEAP